MKRLASALQWDVVLQFRSGFYYATVFVVVLFAFVFTQIPNLDTQLVMPMVLLGSLMMNNFYFIGGILMLEKDQGSLEAVVITPLRSREYILSKLISLLLLSVIETLLLTLLIHGTDFNMLLLLPGLSATSILFALAGFLAAVRYDSVNEYLLPTIPMIMLLILPVIDLYGFWQTPIFYLHPMRAAMALIQGGFQPISAGEIAYGLIYSLLSIGIFGWLAQRSFQRYVILGKGVR